MQVEAPEGGATDRRSDAMTTQPTPSHSPTTTGRPMMNAIDIVVADLEASMSFYRRLGLAFEIDAGTPEHAQCELPNGLHLMLDTEALRGQTTAGWRPSSGGPRAFFAFEFASPAEVDGRYAELTEAGYRGLQEPWDAFWGMRYATVADPDGNGIDLYATLPTA
jgi:catechol 2,3-dioxygenase-like lactoylglutathione lyase family enzyme